MKPKKANYIVKTERGYVVVVEGEGETEITDAVTVRKIKDLLATRKKAGKELSELIHDKGLTTASAHRATIALGDFEEEGEEKEE